MRKIICYVLTLLMLLNLFCTITALAEDFEVRQTLYPVADGYYYYDSDVLKWDGSARNLRSTVVYNREFSRTAFLKFDLEKVKENIQNGAAVAKAVVKLTVDTTNKYAEPARLSLFRIEDDSWTEDATVLPTPIKTADSQSLTVSRDVNKPENNYVLIPASCSGESFYLDVTDYIASEAAKQNDTYASFEVGYRDQSISSGTYAFHSKDASDSALHPQLVIEYGDAASSGVVPNVCFEQEQEFTVYEDACYYWDEKSSTGYSYNGGQVTNLVRDNNGVLRNTSFLKFDLSKIKENLHKGTAIKSAKVQLTFNKIYGTEAGKVSLFKMEDDNWSESAAPKVIKTTKDERLTLEQISSDAVEITPALTTETDEEAETTPASHSTGDKLEFDITDALVTETEKENDSYLSMEVGLVRDDENGGKPNANISLYSKEYDNIAYAPKIIIEYSQILVSDSGIYVDEEQVAAPEQGINVLKFTLDNSYPTAKLVNAAWGIYTVSDSGERRMTGVVTESLWLCANSQNVFAMKTELPALGVDERYEARLFIWDGLDTLVPVLDFVEFLPSDLWVPSVFESGAVLQRDSALPIWGEAEQNSEVSVTLASESAGSKTYTTTADAMGEWSLTAEAVDVSGNPYTLTIKSADNELEYDNILAGDVWLCAGQSNMAFGLSRIDGAQEEIAAADNYSNIRLFSQDQYGSEYDVRDVKNGKWSVCSANTATSFSAVGYLFGKELYDELNVPIGLISASYGGAPAEAFTDIETLKNSELSYCAELEISEADKKPGRLFNAMVEPLIPYSIKGAIWYQGEANRYRYADYTALQHILVDDWREKWGEDFPFIITQLAPYDTDLFENIREAQRQFVHKSENTAMAVIMDCGMKDDIHPICKKPVAHRLALCAEHLVYGKNVEWKYPEPTAFSLAEKAVTITYDGVYDGLMTKDNASLTGFELCGEDGIYHSASAVINPDNTVTVTSDSVTSPKGIRYGFASYPEPEINLYNSAGLIATPFVENIN